MVSSRYPPHLGGIETHVYEVGRRIATQGLDVTVLTTDLTGDLPPIERDGQLTVRRFGARPRRADLYISPALVRQIREGGYDLVHVQGVNNFLPPMALAAAQRSGLPTVVTFHTGGHSSRTRTMVRGAQWRALRPLLRRAKGLVAVCGFEVEVFARRLGVEPRADPAHPKWCRITPGRRCGTRDLGLAVGVLRRSARALQGPSSTDRGDAGAPEMAPDAHLAVIGRGSYERQLRRLAARWRSDMP